MFSDELRADLERNGVRLVDVTSDLDQCSNFTRLSILIKKLLQRTSKKRNQILAFKRTAKTQTIFWGTDVKISEDVSGGFPESANTDDNDEQRKKAGDIWEIGILFRNTLHFVTSSLTYDTLMGVVPQSNGI